MAETTIQCGESRIDALVPRIRDFLGRSTVDYVMLGKHVRGYRSPDSPSIWLRDHSDILRAGRYWEKDLLGVIEHFAETQSSHGWFFDNFAVRPEKPPCERENWARYIRVPVEADVEYRFVKAVFLAWQSTGNDAWLRRMLPHMERGLAYSCSDPWRWDKKRRLVKRAYTVDTWDFDYTAGRNPWLNFQIDEETFWGIMHGDNSGTYEAFRQMATMNRALGQRGKAAAWERKASEIRARANRLCFNGRFYRHRVPITPVEIPGLDDREQLSLSNPMGINRGMATHSMAVAIIEEYQKRGDLTRAFAPWFSIDPPFPNGIFGEEKLVGGAYCNGGIMPLVGGELARAAFDHGFEAYGVEQLLAYDRLTSGGEAYLWYFPDGRHATAETSTSPDAIPTDPWGSAAMFDALAGGLAGVVDRGKLFKNVALSPRWVAAGCTEAQVTLAYPSSGASVSYAYAHDSSAHKITLELRGSSDIGLHLLLPPGTQCTRVRVRNREIPFTNVRVEQSSYVDSQLHVAGKSTVTVEYLQSTQKSKRKMK